MIFWSLAAFAAPLESTTDGSEPLDPSLRTAPLTVADLVPSPITPHVVGGRQVADGDWEDTVGIVFGESYVGCTGTLVGERLVLTAGHCVGAISHVLVGSNDWYSGEGRLYEVEEEIEYPDSQRTYDAALLVLAEPVRNVKPRTIGMECVTDRYLEKGAPVQIVGYGLTREDGQGWNSKKNEAPARVLDPVCKEQQIKGIWTGCNSDLPRGAEIAAGGGGTDACYGDSGGPLYLKTDEGDFVVGITSRSFLGIDPSYPCRDGGIWVRPDAIIDWLMDEAGRREFALPTCNEPPEVEVDALVARGEGEIEVHVDDPDGDADDAEIVVAIPPEHGTATVEGGVLHYVAEHGYTGPDTVGLQVTDAGTEWEITGGPATVDVMVDVTVEPAGALGCGCTTGNGGGGVIGALGAVVLLVARRR